MLSIGPGALEDAEVRAWPVDESAHGLRLDKALVHMAPEFSRSHLQWLVQQQCVEVDGQVQSMPSRRLRLGQTVSVRLVPTEQARAFRPENIPLRVVHEDEHLMVIDKPAGLVVHPAPGHWSGTLLNGLLSHHQAACGLPRAGIVHRLDMDTSGLMVVAKTAEAMQSLSRAIAERKVERNYWAIAHGTVASQEQEIDAPVGRDPRSRIRMAVVGSGKPSRTSVRVLGRGISGYTAVECRLHTGRTHQIRVHLAHVGHPLVGDSLYGGRVGLGIQRQALHAVRLALAHPISGLLLRWESMPEDPFASAWLQAMQVS